MKELIPEKLKGRILKTWKTTISYSNGWNMDIMVDRNDPTIGKWSYWEKRRSVPNEIIVWVSYNGEMLKWWILNSFCEFEKLLQSGDIQSMFCMYGEPEIERVFDGFTN